MPEISVVMPVYNGEEYLPEAIESILDQTFGDFEFLIVCEHGSNEASMEIVERYAEKDKRIRPIYNGRRLGIAASLNVGLETATGKYVARMDGDDLSGPRRFEVQKAFLDAYPDIGVCGTAHTVINSPNWIMDYVADPEQMACDLLFFAVMRHPTIMLRRTLTERCRYDETLTGAEDYDLYLKLSRVTRMGNVMDPSLFAYRRTGENNSAVYKARDVLIRRETQRRAFRDSLGLEFTSHEMDVLNFMGFDAYEDVAADALGEVIRELDGLLRRVEERNDALGAFSPACMTQTLRHRWFREQRKLKRYLKTVPKTIEQVWREGKYYYPWF